MLKINDTNIICVILVTVLSRVYAYNLAKNMLDSQQINWKQTKVILQVARTKHDAESF